MMTATWLMPRLSVEWLPSSTVEGVPLLSQSCAGLDELHVGSQVFARVTVYDEDGFETNTTLAGTMTLPTGAVVSLATAAEATGIYLVTFPVFTVRGFHPWRITATGTVKAVKTGTLHVDT